MEGFQNLECVGARGTASGVEAAPGDSIYASMLVAGASHGQGLLGEELGRCQCGSMVIMHTGSYPPFLAH